MSVPLAWARLEEHSCPLRGLTVHTSKWCETGSVTNVDRTIPAMLLEHRTMRMGYEPTGVPIDAPMDRYQCRCGWATPWRSRLSSALLDVAEHLAERHAD